MKIYAGYNDGILLEKYAGKDIWVKCIDQYSNLGYLRVLSAESGRPYDMIYRVNWVTDDDLELMKRRKFTNADVAEFTATYTMNLNNFDVPDPVVTYTTKELCPAYEFDIHQFDRFVGKDLWVRVSGREGYEDYIKIVDYNFPLISCQSVPVERIEGKWYFRDESELNNAFNRMNEVNTWNADNFIISEPLEVLTEEEIKDIITDFYYNEGEM